MPWIIVFLMLIEFSSAKLASIGIYWNASNPIFRIDNTDHIIDVNRGNNPFEYDQVNIICPTYTEGSKEEAETYIIYNVSKEEFDTCRITNSNPRIIAICDNPLQLKYFTITFRSFTPQPGGLEFKPGNDYYFVTTSTGDRQGLDRKFGGRCSTHHMKVIFKVCCSDSDNNNNNNNNIINNKTLASNHQKLIESSASPSTSISPSPSPSFITPSPSTVSPTPSSHHHVTSSSPSSYQSFTFIGGIFNPSSSPETPQPPPLLLQPVTTTTIAPVTSSRSLISTLLPPPSSSQPSLAASEHWWKPHFTRIENLKWRSKSTTTNQQHQVKSSPGFNADSNASSRNTLQPLAWTVFAISCFIFIIFWALWYKVKRNNVLLPIVK